MNESPFDPPGIRFKKWFKESFEKYKKTPYAIPTAMGIICGLFYLSVAYLSWFCMFGLLPPLSMLIVFWLFGIKGTRKLILLGVICCVLFVGVGTAYVTNFYMDAAPSIARSEEGVLTNGTVSPARGDASTVFTFAITVNLHEAAANATVRYVNVSVWGPAHSTKVLVMDEAYAVNETTLVYSVETTLSKPVNAFIFEANITSAAYPNGYEEYQGTDFEDGEAIVMIGPVFDSGWAVAGYLAPIMTYSSFVVFFPIYAIIVLMIWWTKRARKMREDKMLEWERKRKEAEEASSKEEVKVPSLAKAMGLEKEDTFVCSECGADVPGDATVCPNCGEKFE